MELGTPAINDNGSGSAAILEIALQTKQLGIQPANKVRFIWFAAEENGLLGSEYSVSHLSTCDIKNIAVNLNVEMIASPNYVRFVYDGDGSSTAMADPNGSKNVESVFRMRRVTISHVSDRIQMALTRPYLISYQTALRMRS